MTENKKISPGVEENLFTDFGKAFNKARNAVNTAQEWIQNNYQTIKNDIPPSGTTVLPTSLPNGVNLVFPYSRDHVTSSFNHLMIIYILPRLKVGGTGTRSAAIRDRNTFRDNTPPESSIALYMPNTLNYTQNNEHEDISLTNLAKDGLKSYGGRLGKGAAAALGSIQGVSNMLGRPINPFVEVLFKATSLRTHQFEFLFAPTSSDETDQLKRIIKTLRTAAAPQIAGETAGVGSLSWIPPQKLNFEFYQRINNSRMSLNENIPRVGTCVIDSLDFDFAPSGSYSTFKNGYPVSVRMQLKVKEDNTLTDIFVKDGF